MAVIEITAAIARMNKNFLRNAHGAGYLRLASLVDGWLHVYDACVRQVLWPGSTGRGWSREALCAAAVRHLTNLVPRSAVGSSAHLFVVRCWQSRRGVGSRGWQVRGVFLWQQQPLPLWSCCLGNRLSGVFSLGNFQRTRQEKQTPTLKIVAPAAPPNHRFRRISETSLGVEQDCHRPVVH